MTKYLISFPAPAMDVAEEDWVEVGEASRAVIREASVPVSTCLRVGSTKTSRR